MKGMEILKGIWTTSKSIIPAVSFLVVFQILILKKPIENVKEFAIGFFLSIIGLHLFLNGISFTLIPLGNSLGKNLVIFDNKLFIVLTAFILGYVSTLLEPALKALALEVEEISIGAIPNNVLIHTVAIGFAIGMALGIFKILNNISNAKVIVPILTLSVILTLIAPKEFVGIAFDCASSTTGPINIPINMAIAIGLSKTMKATDPLLNGFGVIGLTSLGPVITVLLLGIVMK